ncbi:MAG TPA: MarR family transcriptional regulator [Kineosporiaceae bacterium]|nr:MarR family transcriptional regulator [Kineosporiaceae bacterium]
MPKTRAAAASSAHSPAGEGAEPTLLYLMKQLELAVRSRLDDLFRPIGLTALQYTALTVLERRPDLSSAELARNSFVTTQTMADMVTSLQARGLIERHRDPKDRRRLVLALAADGWKLLGKYRLEVSDLEAQMLSNLTAEEAVALRRNIQACRSALTHHPSV